MIVFEDGAFGKQICQKDGALEKKRKTELSFPLHGDQQQLSGYSISQGSRMRRYGEVTLAKLQWIFSMSEN